MTNCDAADKSKLETAVNDAIKWLDTSQEVSKEEYEEKQKELEAVYNLNLLRSSLALSCEQSMVLRWFWRFSTALAYRLS